jgi:nucleoside 2-deoxyribosyltransferase
MCSLTVAGWQAYEQLKEINVESKKVFVAMSFAPELKYIFDEGIFPACDECGFKAFRADSEEHTQKICDKIIADIKESRFIVSDFTGQKHGVYFEAGFARGVGLEVIWTCKDDEEEKKNLHFDTRQYNHIFWKDAEDLKKQLIYKIKAVIK